MKKFSLFIVFVGLNATSCVHSQREKVFISNTLEFNHGTFQTLEYSLIRIKQDSLYYFDFPNINKGKYLGKIDTKSYNVETNGTYKINIEDNMLNINDNEGIRNYILLNEPIKTKRLKMDYLIGKKYAIKSKFVNDTILFIDENIYLNSVDNKEFNWSYVDFEGYKFLWQENLVEKVPLQIMSLDNNGFKAMFYGLDEIEIIFEEVP